MIHVPMTDCACLSGFVRDSRKKKKNRNCYICSGFFTCVWNISRRTTWLDAQLGRDLRHTQTNRAYLNHFAKHIWHSARRRYIRISLQCKARFLALCNYFVGKRERTIGTWRKRELRKEIGEKKNIIITTNNNKIDLLKSWKKLSNNNRCLQL